MGDLHVAVGGFRLSHGVLAPAFAAYAVPSMKQARAAPGCVFASARFVEGRYFSLSVWESRTAMRDYARSGPHLRAMRAARWLGSGPFAHFTAAAVPDWDAALAEWQRQHGEGLSAAPLAG